MMEITNLNCCVLILEKLRDWIVHTNINIVKSLFLICKSIYFFTEESLFYSNCCIIKNKSQKTSSNSGKVKNVPVPQGYISLFVFSVVTDPILQ